MIATNRLNFNARVQRDSESASELIAVIQDLADKFRFGTFLNDALWDKLISGIRADDTRRKLLAAKDLTYSNAKQIVLQEESVRKQAKALGQAVQVSRFNTTNPAPVPATAGVRYSTQSFFQSA